MYYNFSCSIEPDIQSLQTRMLYYATESVFSSLKFIFSTTQSLQFFIIEQVPHLPMSVNPE